MATSNPYAKFIRRGTFRWVICDCCEGSGQRDNPCFSNGISSSEWHDEWDQDDRENYLNGVYDVPCTDCGGSGKQQQVIVSSLPWAERREMAMIRREEREREAWQREAAADRRAEMRMMGEW